MKLIKCSDYVIKSDVCQTIYEALNYANFLKRSLTLGMFIPCDEDGNVLEKPVSWDAFEYSMNDDDCPCPCKDKYLDCFEYEEALGRVIFEGFTEKGFKDSATPLWISKGTDTYVATFDKEDNKYHFRRHLETIEDLTELGLTISKTGKQQLI